MKIKLTKSASWDGEKYRSGTVHDLDDKIANKLIGRGYAKLHSKDDPVEVEEDGLAAE